MYFVSWSQFYYMVLSLIFNNSWYLNLSIFYRASRETTPCSLIPDVNNVQTPGSSTRRASSLETNRVVRNPTLQQIPSTREMDELFASAEKEQQEEFLKKYTLFIYSLLIYDIYTLCYLCSLVNINEVQQVHACLIGLHGKESNSMEWNWVPWKRQNWGWGVWNWVSWKKEKLG